MFKDKTGKREVALFMLAVLLGLYLWGILGNPAALAVADSLKVSVFVLVGGAFGADAIMKRMK